MRLFARLLRVQFRQRFSPAILKETFRDHKKKALGYTALYLLLAVSLLSLLGMYAWLLVTILPGFTALGMENLFLGLILLASMVLTFFMGMVYLLGVLFFSKDTEFLSALPIPQRTVFAAKFFQALSGEIATGAVLLLPALIVFGVMTEAGVSYWILSAITILLAPCISMALSGLLSLLLMRFTVLWRRRELLTVIGGILLIAGSVFLQTFLSSSMPGIMSQDAIMTLIQDHSGLLHGITRIFPPSGWAAEGLLGQGGSFLLFAGGSIFGLAALLWIAGKLYYSGAKAQMETASTQKKVRLSGNAIRRHNALYALFMREWRIILRTPVYALNSLTMVIMGPLMLLLPRFVSGGNGGEEMAALLSLLEGAVDSRLIILILGGIFMAVGMINPAITTSVSREGKNYYLLRLLPLSPARQMMAKYLCGLSISCLFMGVTGLVAYLSLGLSAKVMLTAMGLGMLAMIGPLAFSMVADVLKPKLHWNSETEAMKQNMNSMIGMLIGWGYVALLGFGCYKAIDGGMDLSTLLWGISGLSLVMAGLGQFALMKAASRGLRIIEG